MDEIFEKIWQLAIPYLKKGIKKDFIVHTKGVIRSMRCLLEREEGDKSILIPAAILHDVGWSKVPLNMQKSDEELDRVEALRLHIKHASSIIKEILLKVGYDEIQIEKVINIVAAHKFQDPKELSKQLLIDADTMSDAFKQQFYSDVRSYKTTPEELYEFRKKNDFYTQTARKIFDEELEKRRKEFKG